MVMFEKAKSICLFLNKRPLLMLMLITPSPVYLMEALSLKRHSRGEN